MSVTNQHAGLTVNRIFEVISPLTIGHILTCQSVAIFTCQNCHNIYISISTSIEGRRTGECSDSVPITFSFSKYSETTKVPIFSITHPGLWVGLYNRMIEDSELGVSSCVLLVMRYNMKFRIVSLLVSWMRELSAAKLREFYRSQTITSLWFKLTCWICSRPRSSCHARDFFVFFTSN